MRDIIFECNATEFKVYPDELNDVNEFSLTNEAMVISMKRSDTNVYLAQTEIDKESAIELAQIILLKYKK